MVVQVSINGRCLQINGCDRFTRWFYEPLSSLQNGIELSPDEEVVKDAWQEKYKLRKLTERGGLPTTKSAYNAKQLAKYQIGAPPADVKFSQFLLNDRKVLRFKAFWDDHTPYGARIYFIIHYFLADNTVEINMFMKRGPLSKKNEVLAVPGMLAAEGQIYFPRDLMVGQSIDVWGRKLVLWDCDEATQKFYKEYMGIDQWKVTHLKLKPPPHTGVGREEDSLINCQMVQPKPPKKDLERLMIYTGEVLRFECNMVNGEPEDELRKLVIAYYPADGDVAVFEAPVRNSGHMGGKFADKRKIKNPDTGEYFKLEDFFVGQTVTVAAQPLQIVRADEHCLQYLEARPREFPFADPVACAQRVAPLAGEPEMQDPQGLEPERLKELAASHGICLIDHEVVTLLRHFGIAGESDDAPPRILGPELLAGAKSIPV
ncbi:efhc2 [Symbiodinium natans]|uniref:Efhc2 protein n=1 Tax=Symbiodinium natans TaxID=878477 RepID=A0A812RJV1_9DINO|nr:efhc2 [Symbiodinium natans]